MECPRCEGPLEIWNLVPEDQTFRLDVERCGSCHGIFFNPGELQSLLHNQVVSTIWLDLEKLETMRPTESDPLGRLGVRERHYLPCPTCKEIMNSQNFGRRSGVLVDLCRHHGIWLDGGELQKVSEWWRAGGEHLYKASETKRAESLQAAPVRRDFGASMGSAFADEHTDLDYGWKKQRSGTVELLSALAAVVGYFMK